MYIRYRSRSVLTLGIRGEVCPYDFTQRGWDAEILMEKLHNVLYTALVDRDVYSIYLWSQRVEIVFKRNHIEKIGHIINMSESKVFSLIGCGYVVRKEVFNVFQTEFGIHLPSWNPIRWYQKYRTYRFDDDEELPVQQDEEDSI